MALGKFLCRKIVGAGRIVRMRPPDISGRAHGTLLLGVEQSDGSVLDIESPPAMFARYQPAIGDYYVVYEPDGYASISPCKIFEDGYERIC